MAGRVRMRAAWWGRVLAAVAAGGIGLALAIPGVATADTTDPGTSSSTENVSTATSNDAPAAVNDSGAAATSTPTAAENDASVPGDTDLANEPDATDEPDVPVVADVPEATQSPEPTPEATQSPEPTPEATESPEPTPEATETPEPETAAPTPEPTEAQVPDAAVVPAAAQVTEPASTTAAAAPQRFSANSSGSGEPAAPAADLANTRPGVQAQAVALDAPVAEGAVPTATPLAAAAPSVAPSPPPAVPDVAAVPAPVTDVVTNGVHAIRAFVYNVLGAFGIGPVADGQPAPVSTPILFGVLAWVREEIGRTFGLIDPASARTTGQLVDPNVDFGPNLLVNPGAELGDASLSGYSSVTVAGWAVTGTPTVIKYDTARRFPWPLGDPGADAARLPGLPAQRRRPTRAATSSSAADRWPPPASPRTSTSAPSPRTSTRATSPTS